MELKLKKSLGQNFLRDEKVLEKIINLANLQLDDFVIEIGPGEGVLTEKLAQKAGRVLAIEIDQNLIQVLEKKFSNEKNVEMINADILKINLKPNKICLTQQTRNTTVYNSIATSKI